MSNEVSGAPAAFKPKKSVALSGTPAGSTALCTVGHSGNDLHYRGYDIKDLAAHCEFEEVAYLLVHGKLPNVAELAAYKASLRPLRSLPAAVKQALELLPPSTHPMDVLRTGVSVLGCVLPEGESHKESGARKIADTLLAKHPETGIPRVIVAIEHPAPVGDALQNYPRRTAKSARKMRDRRIAGDDQIEGLHHCSGV